MKTPSEDHDLIRWLDGEMSPTERERFAARLEADPGLKAEAEAMRQLGATLRAHLPTEMPVPHSDFFNSQIQVRLAQEDEAERRLSARPAGWLAWFRLPGFATAITAAAAVVIAAVIIWKQDGEPQGESVVLSTYTPNPGVQARAFHSNEAQATVLMLEGLEAMPPDRKIMGYNIQRSEREQDVATTLYGERGEVLMVVSQDARHQPRLLTAASRHP
jgi:anti-sigma factor RsiW